MPWIEKTNTLVHAWYGGQETGHGLVDVLLGAVNPSGRLSITFPRSIKHTPAYLTFGKADRDIMYGEGVYVGHRFYEAVDRQPLFYFGYGLTYTQFDYSAFIVPTTISLRHEDIEIPVTVTVTNVGHRDGAEVIQLYLYDHESSVQRPARELKVFSKLYLTSGESETVTLQLTKYALSFWSEEHGQWVAEKGDFDVILARSSDPIDEIMRRTLRLEETFMWSGI